MLNMSSMIFTLPAKVKNSKDQTTSSIKYLQSTITSPTILKTSTIKQL